MSKDMFVSGAKESMFLKFKQELYGVPKASLNRDRDTLLLRNINKLNYAAADNTQTYFNGVWHVLSFNDPRSPVVRLELDKEFHAEMTDIENQFDELESEELDMIAYLKRILNTSMTFADLKNLTPHCLHFTLPQFIGGHSATHHHEKITMNPVDIARWRHTNEDAEEFVKRRMLTNLLLPRES